MKLTWLTPGRQVATGLEEAQLEIEWTPGIPVAAVFGAVPPPSRADRDERDWLLGATRSVVAEIGDDVLTRRAVVYNLYPGELKANCISLLHFTVREFLGVSRLLLYVYARSTDLRSLAYDLTTVDMAYARVRSELAARGTVVELGPVTVHLHSLHYYQLPEGETAC